MSITAYTFNVQHGEGTDGVTNYQRQIDAMAGADLVAVQERSHPDTGWDTPLSNAGMAQAIYRPNQIGGGDGNAIWYKSSTVTILNTYEVQLSTGATSPWDGIPTNVDKCAVAAKVQAEGQQFYFVGTHLCQAAGADSNGALTSTIRESQINTLISFINSNLTGLDVLISADFNFAPNYLLNGGGFQDDLFTNAGFVNLWPQGVGRGIAGEPWADLDATGGPDQAVTINTITHDTRHIDDHRLRSVNGVLNMASIRIRDMRVTCSTSLTGSPLRCPDVAGGQLTGTVLDYGVRPTDHNPMDVTFTVSEPRRPRVRLIAISM
jgi:endonuclease/exonuclease/phosphatase family metal-dependent hydrolase